MILKYGFHSLFSASRKCALYHYQGFKAHIQCLIKEIKLAKTTV